MIKKAFHSLAHKFENDKLFRRITTKVVGGSAIVATLWFGGDYINKKYAQSEKAKMNLQFVREHNRMYEKGTYHLNSFLWDDKPGHLVSYDYDGDGVCDQYAYFPTAAGSPFIYATTVVTDKNQDLFMDEVYSDIDNDWSLEQIPINGDSSFLKLDRLLDLETQEERGRLN